MSAPAINDGIVLYAIGDIHGHADKLARLLGDIAKDAAAFQGEVKRLVFLGDYIDRGPATPRVLDIFLRELPHDWETVFVRGNHEDMLLRILAGETDLMRAWLRPDWGGAATLAAYGVDVTRPGILEAREVLRMELSLKMPPEHLDFLRRTVFSHTCGGYHFAHAGVRPGVALERQEAEDLMWIRREFLDSDADFGKIVVHGHTISVAPEMRANRIGIDTGAFATGRLTALRLSGEGRAFLST